MTPRHWAGTLRSAAINRRRSNSTRAQRPHPFNDRPSTSDNGTFARYRTRVRFPADLLTWRNAGQGRRDVDSDERSPLVTVAGIAALFFCCTIAGTVALGVFCRKRNTVFPLEIKSDAEDDEDAADECNDAETVPSTSKNSHYHHHHHHHRSRQEDSVSVNMYMPTPESPQPSASHEADTVAQLFHPNDHHFRFTDSPFPVASAHAHYDAACCHEAVAVQPEDLNEANFRVQQSEVSSDQFGTASRINYDVDAAPAPAADMSSPSPLSSFFTFSSLISTLHKRRVLRSLGHVLNSRWIRRRVPAAATGDQSAPSNAAHDHVDMTSLLPAL